MWRSAVSSFRKACCQGLWSVRPLPYPGSLDFGEPFPVGEARVEAWVGTRVLREGEARRNRGFARSARFAPAPCFSAANPA